MSYPVYGQYHVAEPPHLLNTLHFHKKTASLKEVDWEPKIAVLDQSDLIAQGIDTSVLIPGATKVDALGSCTANANASALSNVLDPLSFVKATGASSYTDTVGVEKFAINFYHRCTDQTGDPAQEWPPTDCGSSGQYVVSENQAQGLCSGAEIASGAQNIISLLQTGGILQGTPFFFAWEEPDHLGFVDGEGTVADIEAAIASGVAGGHETYISAIVKLALDAHGNVDPFNTVLRVRNSWGPAWGLHGSFLIHLSTLVALGSYCDFRQLKR